jgi:glycosyltransferase involved in cell wall biosynthesis
MPPETFVIVAAHNESERIEQTLSALALAFPGSPIWVAEDGSSDATAQLADRAGARVVRSGRAIGKGAAVTHAAREALHEARASAGDASGRSIEDRLIFIFCDGDLGSSARELGALVDTVRRGEADIAVAAFSRRIGGGFGLALRFASWAIRRRCGLEANAPISGQRALRADVLREVLPFAHGFGMEIGMTIDAVRAGYRLVEVEIDLDHRATGRTLAGFAHRARQLVDFARVYRARRQRLRTRVTLRRPRGKALR